MRNYDGVHKCQEVRRAIERAGYTCAFTTIDRGCPTEVQVAGRSGWAIRRAIKSWARMNRCADYQIFRATDYLKDLHGVVYEVYVKAEQAEGEA